MIKTANPQIKNILEKYKKISLLVEISSILHWDQNTYMPSMGAENRSAQATAMEELITDTWNEPALKSLIEAMDNTVLNDVEKALLRNIRRVTNYYYKVPKKVILKFASVSTKAFSVWQEARTQNSFKTFEPYLTEIVSLKKEIAGCLGYDTNPYDALLDLYEPGLTSAQCENVFTELQPPISRMLKRIVSSSEYNKPNPFQRHAWRFDESHQRELTRFLLTKMTYSQAEGRLDVSAHPFTTTLGRHDVRITTKYHEDDIRSAYASTIHEAGHGLYELGIEDSYSHTPFAGGVSLGIHESQSRFWENQIGRSREFISYMYPIFQTLFPDVFNGSSESDFLKHVNHVKPGFIRIESDEVTYNLHIILRFEIESALINGTINVKDVPEVWGQKMKQYLGISPSTDREGCLQDVHWSYGDMGYFPTYCLGTLFAAQFTEKMKKQLKFDNLVAAGELTPILGWLQKNIHQYGARYTPQEIIKRVSGEALTPHDFVNYLEKKYTSIYNLK